MIIERAKGRLLKSAWRAFGTFSRREWGPAFVSAGIGIVGAALLHLSLFDAHFSGFYISKYLPARGHFDGPHVYFPFALGFTLMVLVALLPRITAVAQRGLRSYVEGVTSGLRLTSFISSLILFCTYKVPFRRLLLVDIAVILTCFAISYGLYFLAQLRRQKPILEQDVRVRDEDVNSSVGQISDTDDPIRDWAEDILGRAPIVSTISSSVLVYKTPVLALFGRLGSGKTSVLNLLQRHLEKSLRPKAIVVSFNTWLPGSSETLTSYLLDDIARECSKFYVVPGIRKDARRLALALAKSTPLLSWLSDLFSNSTQRDDIRRLAAAVSRLPRRLVVLLDEVDRMGKEEIMELLKVLRGVTVSDNLSFVCALDRERVEQSVTGEFSSSSNLYFEKFFPTSVSIPVMDDEALKVIGADRLVSTLNRQHWFEVDDDRETYLKEIKKIWDDRIAPFCQTIRAVGLLANDLGAAAQPLKGEVNPVDLTLIEMLGRFEPSVYEIVWRYRETLTGPDHSFGRYHFRSNEEKAELSKRLLEELGRAVDGASRLDSVKLVLDYLFPLFPEIDGRRPWARGPKAERGGAEKKLADPSLIKAYFYRMLPKELFSSMELSEFLREFQDAPSFNTKVQKLSQQLDLMEKADPKRQNFLEKLSDKVKTASLDLAIEMAHASMVVACKYSYDIFAGMGEAGDALRILIRVGERIRDQGSSASAFLSKCIIESGDDTMALRVLTLLSKRDPDFDLGISFAELYPSFVQRMRLRYGREIETQTVDLTCSDAKAFGLWGSSDLTKQGVTVDPEDKSIQREFWLRYIGNSAVRLSEAFNRIFMPEGYGYESDPTPVIESKIPVADLRGLYETSIREESVSEADRNSLRRLEDFLAGKFKNGVSNSRAYFEG